MKLAFSKRNKNFDNTVVNVDKNHPSSDSVKLQYDETGIVYPYQSPPKNDADFYWESLADEELVYLLDENYILSWEELFQILQDPEHESVRHLLNLPPISFLKPMIRSEGGFSDSDFRVILEGWCDQKNVKSRSITKRVGAILNIDNQNYLLEENTWKLLEKIKEFSRLTDKNESINKRYWAQIRSLANKSSANLDEFLRKTIVLDPAKLQLNLRKNLINTDSVVEIQPVFDDAPDNWIKIFDSYNEVQDQYAISLPDGGLAHIIIESQVKNVLNEIKKMPNRRVSGERAQTFLHNPFAQLGDDAADVIPPESFEQSKQEAEIYNYSMQIDKAYDELNHYISAKLTLHENSSREQAPVSLELANIDQTKYFIQAYEKPMPVFLWAGYAIDKTNNLDKQVDGLKQDLENIQKYQDELQTKSVLDLNNYSDRVIGIGEAEKLNPEFIKQNSGESDWLPDNLLGVSEYEAQPTTDMIMQLDDCIRQAESDGKDYIIHPQTQAKIELSDAKSLLSKLQQKNGEPVEQDYNSQQEPLEPKKKSTLLIADNIEEAKYTKTRAEQLSFDEQNPPKPRLPSSFRNQEFSLKKHQEYGIAWLQNLQQYVPNQVSGCLLADDMGLGKTLQLLCFIGEYLENSKEKKPILVVAPVSLLENWEAEANRFFSAKFGKILSLYGDNLKERKIPKQLIAAQLKDEYGITKLLHEDWLGDSNIVLTTYETMRDLEFSLGRIDWGIMICDEAQKIKVPSAMVTKAAKAQKADFKIACTGTPVENSLVDLWCLFDFIQENLLGSLSDFNKQYRKAIESPENSDGQILEQLRNLIAPQVLRRMKHDVAELPAKHEVNDCKNINISVLQRRLYARIANDFKQMSEQGNKGAMLGALHSMRMICAHPLQFEPNASIQDSPKIDWLIKTLEQIKAKNEKVIIFTEFREIQVFLKRILLERFGLNITTVNGDSNTSSKKGLTRQNLIDKFQQTDGFNAIILSTVAVGFGVNIQKANHVIHFTRSWNPAKEDQATDRAYRIGQDKEVFVYYPSVIAQDFETFEIKLDRLLSSKRSLADDMLRPNNEITQELMKLV